VPLHERNGAEGKLRAFLTSALDVSSYFQAQADYSGEIGAGYAS